MWIIATSLTPKTNERPRPVISEIPNKINCSATSYTCAAALFVNRIPFRDGCFSCALRRGGAFEAAHQQYFLFYLGRFYRTILNTVDNTQYQILRFICNIAIFGTAGIPTPAGWLATVPDVVFAALKVALRIHTANNAGRNKGYFQRRLALANNSQ